MSGAATPRVRALSIHAHYRCRQTGACCSSGWPIPVEPRVEAGLRAALRAGTLETADPDEGLRPTPGLPHGARVTLGQDASGRCVFLETTCLCAVHRRLGECALPSACRHFPRVATLTPLGVSVTLSHYCPTAAALLFRPVIPRAAPDLRPVIPRAAGLRPVIPRAAPGLRPRDPQSRRTAEPSSPDGAAAPRDDGLHIVENPPAFPTSWPWEGLDARDAMPPLLRPGVLMDWPGVERWERFAVGVMAEPDLTPEAALDVLEATAEAARSWTPRDGPFAEFFDHALSSRGQSPHGAPSSRGQSPGGAPSSRGRFPAVARGIRRHGGRQIPRRPARPGLLGMTGPTPPGLLEMAEAWRLVAEAVPHRERLAPVPEGLERAEAEWVAPAWPHLARPLRNWLAAKAFASWLLLQGQGLRTAVFGLRVALAVLRAEAARGCSAAGRPLDEGLLLEAVRRSDLLLVHLADPEALAQGLSRVEGDPAPAERGRP